MRCDQCEMLNINGVNCHETSCPNAKKTWISDREAWVLFVECRECGDDVEVGECCGCCPDTCGETEAPFCLECDSAIDDQGNCECEDEDEDEDEPFCGDVRCNLPSNHRGECREDAI
jgi:hypothetical protein